MTRFRARYEQAMNGLNQTSTEEDRRIAWAAATILEFAEMSSIEGREVQLEDVLVNLVSDVALICGRGNRVGICARQSGTLAARHDSPAPGYFSGGGYFA